MIEEKKYCIYVLENKINGKKYYGQTGNVRRRFTAYKNLKCEKQPKIYAALLKHGFENFNFRIVINNLVLEEADELETYFIKLYNTTILGYNIRHGGNNSKISEETLIKVRKFTPIQETDIVNHYKNNISVKQLSLKYNCHYDTILSVLKRNNLKVCKRTSLDLFTEFKIIEDYKTGVLSKDLSEKYSIKVGHVLCILKKHKIPTHSSRKFTKEIELQIIQEFKNSVISKRQLAKKYNSSHTYISSLLKKYK